MCEYQKINWESEWAKDFYPLVVSLRKDLSKLFRKKKECPIIPVQLCMEAVTQLENSFRFPNFIFYSRASLIQLSVNGRDKLCKYVEVFFFCSALSQSLMSLLHQTAPPQNKRSRLNQMQLLMLHYRDVGKLEILTCKEQSNILHR